MKNYTEQEMTAINKAVEEAGLQKLCFVNQA